MDKIIEPNLLKIDRGSVSAPAGCGKTHLIAAALTRHSEPKPILILTHTNAGVAALRGRLDGAGVRSTAYRLATLDGWAMRLISTFPMRSQHEAGILNVVRPGQDYPAIRLAAAVLLQSGHVANVLAATYDRLLVDEYQDCSEVQHAIVGLMSETLRTCVLGDPLQAIFGFAGRLAHWEMDVCSQFPPVGELTKPWRWVNAGTTEFGEWLLNVRKRLLARQSIDLRSGPSNVIWVPLDGSADHTKRLQACRTQAPLMDGGVLIIAESRDPPGQRRFASQTPGAVTVESVDLRDLASFGRNFDLGHPEALREIVSFAGNVMTGFDGLNFLRLVEERRGKVTVRSPTDAEQAALEFEAAPSYRNASNVLVELSKQNGVRSHRPTVLAGCVKALQTCSDELPETFGVAVTKIREENRLLGRPLPARAVGSTLLLKGLEAEVAVILDTSSMDRANLYVAMTRGSKKLIVCSATPLLATEI